jgi:DNA polymerase-3 subunit gamma/tau
MEDRHSDVLEMDAASRTGIDDIRELIDGVRYRPSSARFKVYIIDEIHMLSIKAFNALLKTLEEPPPHVKFILATTEIRKVPVTVMSRCQRFDLRRVDSEVLTTHLQSVCVREDVAAEPEALALMARAADGSVRDALSFLDQAIVHAEGTIRAIRVREMLGLADRVEVFDLFETISTGRVKEGLELLRRQYAAGADPVIVLQDLLDLTHWLTRVKVVPEVANEITVPESERIRGREFAEKLRMPVLTRTWQMLLKGLDEARLAPDPLGAVEMVLIRLAFASDLPTPAELLREVRGETRAANAVSAPTAGRSGDLPADSGEAGASTMDQGSISSAERPVGAIVDEGVQDDAVQRAERHPRVAAVLAAFPGAKVAAVRPRTESCGENGGSLT